MANVETINQALPTDTFCTKVPDPPKATAIRFYGGLTLSPQLDPSKGAATPCSSSLSLLSKLEPALAPLAPLLSILDAVVHIAQCLLIMKEVISNPFKVPDLLKCIPEMVSKINQLLALIPPFPQGVVSMLQMALDILTTAQTELDCVISQLQSIDADLHRIQALLTKVNEAEDEVLAQSMLDQANCAQKSVNDSIDAVLAVLGPLTRVICTMRTFLALTGDKGKEIAKRLALPSLDNITVLDDAIVVLRTFKTILSTTIDLIESIGFPLGLEAPPALVFHCPLDSSSALESTTPPQAATPTLTAIVPNTVVGASGHPDLPVRITGMNLDDSTQVFFNTAQVPIDNFMADSATPNGQVILAHIPGGLLTPGAKTFQITAVNVPVGGAPAFSGLSQQAGGTPASTSTAASNQIPFTVT